MGDSLSSAWNNATTNKHEVFGSYWVPAAPVITVPAPIPTLHSIPAPVAAPVPLQLVHNAPLIHSVPQPVFHSAPLPFQAPVAPAPLAAAPAPVAAPVPVAPIAPVAPSSQFHAQDEFGQFSFGYQNINSARTESKDAFGVTRGSYQY